MDTIIPPKSRTHDILIFHASDGPNSHIVAHFTFLLLPQPPCQLPGLPLMEDCSSIYGGHPRTHATHVSIVQRDIDGDDVCVR